MAADTLYLWLDHAHEPAANMAIDEVLLAELANDATPVLRTYDWDRPAFTIGYFQPFSVAPAGRHTVIRRPTGGGVVDHTADLTFSLVVPKAHDLCKVDRFTSYRMVNEAVLSALTKVGVEAWLTDEADEVEDRKALVCFQSPAKYDVIGRLGKICGGAQRRTATGMLLQCSIEMRNVGAVSRPAIIQALADAIADLLEATADSFTAETSVLTAADALVRNKYSTDAWNHKR